MRKPNHEEIVSRVEARLYKHMIDLTGCLESCKCAKCFQKYIDSVLAASDAATPQLEYVVAPVELETFIG